MLTEGPDLTERWRFSCVVSQVWRERPAASACAPAVLEMHERSGLWAEIEAGLGSPVLDLEAQILGTLLIHGHAAGQVQIGGYSCHFDRAVLAARMPTLHRFLSHRIVDVPTLRSLYWGIRGLEAPKQEPAHRALSDCDQAIAELRRYLPYLYLPYLHGTEGPKR